MDEDHDPGQGKPPAENESIESENSQGVPRKKRCLPFKDTDMEELPPPESEPDTTPAKEGVESEQHSSQEEATFVNFVDCHFTADRGEVPLAVLKKIAEQIIIEAGDITGSAFKLGKLDRSGPYITPTDIPRSWKEVREYIWFHGDKLRFFMVERRQGRFRATIGLAGIAPLSDMEILHTEMQLMYKGIKHMELRPASRDEVEAELDE